MRKEAYVTDADVQYVKELAAQGDASHSSLLLYFRKGLGPKDPETGEIGFDETTWKLRTMPRGAHAQRKEVQEQYGLDKHNSVAGDPRRRGLGKLMSKIKVDELPQLLQLRLLGGHLNVYGHRPAAANDIDAGSHSDIAIRTTLEEGTGLIGPGYMLPPARKEELDNKYAKERACEVMDRWYRIAGRANKKAYAVNTPKHFVWPVTKAIRKAYDALTSSSDTQDMVPAHPIQAHAAIDDVVAEQSPRPSKRNQAA